jgi:hypothetical protein
MFMVVSFPWPVPSAHVELAGTRPPREEPALPGAPRDDSPQPQLAVVGRAA